MTRKVKPPLPTVTRQQARQLREGMTESERRLWQGLRASQLPWRFRRQHPVAPYIADFACVQARLIIELDGSQHAQASDAARTRYLASQGWYVLRIWDNEVFENLEGVVARIWEIANHRTLTPTPLPEGEGL